MNLIRIKRTPQFPVIKILVPAGKVHNPEKVSLEKLEPHKGWRFLYEEEVHDRDISPQIEAMDFDGWSAEGFVGDSVWITYRTKLPYPIP